jgi:hypothetical protein
MPDTPTAELCARRILKLFAEQGLRTGDVLEAARFVAPFARLGWTTGDFELGIEYAMDEDWLEQVSAEGWRLTRHGFAEA